MAKKLGPRRIRGEIIARGYSGSILIEQNAVESYSIAVFRHPVTVSYKQAIREANKVGRWQFSTHKTNFELGFATPIPWLPHLRVARSIEIHQLRLKTVISANRRLPVVESAQFRIEGVSGGLFF